VSKFLDLHPGGAAMLQMVAGKDATDYFTELHKPEVCTVQAAYLLLVPVYIRTRATGGRHHPR
jgi:cytochrome b involved in lipid metabolism